MSDTLTWTIKKHGGDTVVAFSGRLGESADLTPLEVLEGDVTFDLAGVTRINSEGIRRWINFMQTVAGIKRLRLVRCSTAVVEQLNMIRGVEGPAEVVSFYAPYRSTATGNEELRLLHVNQVEDPMDPPVFPCSDGGELVLDDLPERYLYFLTQRPPGDEPE